MTTFEENITNSNFAEVLGEKYLSYALSTIMSRSLPDVRDGLKPVHRRLLYAMAQLRLRPNESYKKCARVVGDVIGKYHPHGDSAVYDTLVRLAQSFTLRYPMIDGQGNFGSIDGDNPAAMRYTESKLTEIAMLLMEDLEKNTVLFKATYDDSDSEPSLLPAKFPNLLCNGSEGIAVGMATSIPPHNLEEVCNAALHLISNREASVKELMNFMDGPDFPTGGIVYDNQENILSIYETGKGSIRIRARWCKEELGHGLYHIVINQIPYQVQKSKIIENIATLLRDKKIPLITNIRDESTEDIRIIIEPKNRSIEAEHVMESLFKQTDLETRFSYNINVLSSKGIPIVMNLKEVLEEFIEFRFSVITKRCIYEKEKIDARLEILQGLKIAYLNLDEVITIIREEDEPKIALKIKYNLSDSQVESILNMRLKSLRKLEEIVIDNEISDLSTRRIFLSKILDDKTVCWNEVVKEIQQLIKAFGQNTELGARRTSFIEMQKNIEMQVNIEAFIEKEPISIILSRQGWIRAIKNSIEDEASLKFKDGDSFGSSMKAYTTDYISFVSQSGRFYSIFANNISKGKGFGDPIRMIIDLAPSDEIVSAFIHKEGARFIICSQFGKGFIVEVQGVFAQKKQGKQIMNLVEKDRCIKIIQIEKDHDMIACSSLDRKILIFPINEIPTLKKGQGVNLMKLKNSNLVDVVTFDSSIGFAWQSTKDKKIQSNFVNWSGKRAGSGKPPPFGFSKSGFFV